MTLFWLGVSETGRSVHKLAWRVLRSHGLRSAVVRKTEFVLVSCLRVRRVIAGHSRK